MKGDRSVDRKGSVDRKDGLKEDRLKRDRRPKGFLALTLHAHLPYVVNHGTWPHGMEWLLEAAAETYLPLLRMLGRLERDGIRANLNINLSPVLLEQLSHPTFIAEFPKYAMRKTVAAREDEAFFIQAGETHLAKTARFWHQFFSTALEEFHALNGRIVDGFRYFQDAGMIETLTSGATHGYMPLLGTDESLRAQVRVAVATHKRWMGKVPRGIWVPECGYRPAGRWEYPVEGAGEGFDRIGVEQAVVESGLEYFFVDTHLVEESRHVASPYGEPEGARPEMKLEPAHAERSLYQTYYVDGPSARRGADERVATVFPRDPRTGMQVWSGDLGYPGDPNYLDFHKKRFPGGHRYWQVTGDGVSSDDKQLYSPEHAAERALVHADHFVGLVRETLGLNQSGEGQNDAAPRVLSAPFDAELFGHWWFEGTMWLEAVCRKLAEEDSVVATIQCSEYLDRYPRAGFIAMDEGSWGAEGNNHVWLNHETSWTYRSIYAAELFVREMASGGRWRETEKSLRVAKQMCRELLLLESSDWQFLITTGAARDYSEMRFVTHRDQFEELRGMWEMLERGEALNEGQSKRLGEIELRDNIFEEIDPAMWARGAREVLAEDGKTESAA